MSLNWPHDFKNRILTGDCLELMKRIPDQAIDVIITDPVWPDCKPDLPGKQDAARLFANAAKEFARLAPRVIIHLGITTDPRLLVYISTSLPFIQCCWLRWIPPSYRGPILVSADVAYVFGHTRLPGDGSRVFGAESKDEVNSVNRKNKKYDPRKDTRENPHPTSRSITHVSWLVQRFSRPGDLILDPFCGAGTTCVAARLAGRNFCGMEIDPTYADYASDRVAAPDLWNPRRAVQ